MVRRSWKARNPHWVGYLGLGRVQGYFRVYGLWVLGFLVFLGSIGFRVQGL